MSANCVAIHPRFPTETEQIRWVLCTSLAASWQVAWLELNFISHNTLFWLLLSTRPLSTVEIVGRHEQLQTKLTWDLHVRYAGLITIFLVVIKVFDDLFQNDTREIGEFDTSGTGFAEGTCP